MSSRLKLLHGDDAKAAFSGTTIHEYGLNKPVLVVMGGLAAICAGLTIGFFFYIGIGDPLNLAAFIIGCVASVYFAGRAYYWVQFASDNLVALSESQLLVGTLKRVWAIDYEMLDTEKLGLDRMELGKMSASLNIQVAGQLIPLRLYNAFVFLNDLEVFIGSVLERVAVVDGESEE